MMYETFYHFDEPPFRLTPDTKFSFHHRSYQQALDYLRYALMLGEGFVIITGRSGTGKTTLIEDFLNEIKLSKVIATSIASTNLKPTDLLRAAAYAYGIDAEGLDKATIVHRFEQFFLQQSQHGARTLLILDEAQSLSHGALEELRLLADLHTRTGPMLQVFLVGQEKLLDLVHAPDMEQFQQRVIGSCHLEPLDARETCAYMGHRLRLAGWKGDPQLTGAAVFAIYQYSKGVPRHINKLCTRLLSYGLLESKHELDEADVLPIAAELREEQLAPMESYQAARVAAGNTVPAAVLGNGSLSLVADLALRMDAPHAASADTRVRSDTVRKRQQRPTLRPAEQVPETRPPQQDKPTPTPHRLRLTSWFPPRLWPNRWHWPGVSAATHRLKQRLPTDACCAAASACYARLRRWGSGSAQKFADRLEWTEEPALLVSTLIALVLSTSAALTLYFGGSAGGHNVSPPGEPVRAQGATVVNQSRSLPSPAVHHQNAWAAQQNAGQSAAVPPSVLPTPLPLQVQTPPSVVPVTNGPATALSASDPGETIEASALATAPGVLDDEASIQSGGPADKPPASAPPAEPPPVVSIQAPSRADTAQPGEPATRPGTAQTSGALASLETRVDPVSNSVSESVSVEQKINRLLARGRQSLSEYRMLIPEADSAYHYFQQVLLLEPGNSKALQGVEQIVLHYITQAKVAIERQNKDKARLYVARGLRVQPEDERLLALQASINAPAVRVDANVRRPPNRIPLEAPPLLVDPEAQPEGFFSKMKAFFSGGQASAEKDPIRKQ